MNFRFPLPCAALAALALSLGSAPAQVPGTVEPFSFQTNADSWTVFDYADGGYYFADWDLAGDGVNPDIWFTFAGDAPLDFYAEEASSNGAFAGDYAASGVDAIGCDVFIEDASTLEIGEFFLFSTTDERYHYSADFVPQGDGWDFAISSLGDTWYVITDGAYVATPLTPEVLAGVVEIGFTFYPLDAGADTKAVGIDNFTLFASLEPPPVEVATVEGELRIGFDRRTGVTYTIQSSPDLTNWTAVPGEEAVTGDTRYFFTREFAPGAVFYQVALDDDLVPVPEMDAP